ncbi:MAG: hypothetical protein ABIQ88_23450 [Chitinophagaceae bacterium]
MNTINLYDITLYFDLAIASIALFGFICYLLKGPASTEVTAGWIFMLLMLTFIILAGVVLKSLNHHRLSLLPLFLMAVTGIIYLCLLLLMNIFKIQALRGQNKENIIIYNAGHFNLSAVQ